MGAIGIFDSGVGGLSVWREITRLMPKEPIIYFSDSGHVPYGEKTPKELIRLSKKICKFLLLKKVKLVVIACNTATAYCIEKLRGEFNIPFVGTVPPVKPAAASSKIGKVAVMATPATVRSAYLSQLISDFSQGSQVVKIPAYYLEDQVEDGKLNGYDTKLLLEKYLKSAKLAGIDGLALGCTHYPFLISAIKKIIGAQVKIFNPAPAVAAQVRRILTQNGQLLNKKLSGVGVNGKKYLFYTTGAPKKFSQVAGKLLKRQITAKKVSL